MGTKVYDNYEDLITFNRNSKGTALRPIGYGDELVVNGTFDTDSDWVKTDFTISGGQASTSSGIAGNIDQSISFVSGKVYEISVDVVSISGGSGSIQARGVSTVSSLINTGDIGTTHKFIYADTSNNTTLRVFAGSGTNLTIDNVSVKEVLFDREGDPLTLFLHPEGVPRIEYDADRNLKGLLIEPDGENKCLQSEDINAAWNPIRATQTQSTEETPDGDTSSKYIKLVDDGSDPTGTSTAYVFQTIAVTGGTKYTASVFLKKSGLDWAALQAGGTGSVVDGNPIQYFDLDNGVTGTGSAGIQDATIEAYPNDWYRCSITWTQGAGDTSFNFIIYVAEADNGAIVDLDGTSSIFAWGAQVEAGPIATSYMPTTISPFTRDADDASMTNVSGLIGQKEGTLYFEGIMREYIPGGFNYRALMSIEGSGGSIRILRSPTSSDTFFVEKVGGSGGVFISSGTVTGTFKCALAYADNDYELYVNGVSKGTGTSAGVPSPFDTIGLGQDLLTSGSARIWNDHIRAVQIIPRRLSDAQIIELTS